MNNLNQLTNVARTETMTVAGTTTSPATNVTVNTLTAERYADRTFARAGVSLNEHSTTFTAIAKDSLGRVDTNSMSLLLGVVIQPVYDANGNLRTNGARLFDYDDENRLTRITEPDKWKSEFVYDGKMRMRISRDYAWRSGAWVQTNEVRRVYDGNLVLQERDQLNVPKVTYTRGNDLSGSLQGAGGIGGLLGFAKHTTTESQHYCYHADGNGNITALLSGQIIVGRYLYDPFGNLVFSQGSLAAENLYRFSSKEAHPLSSLIYYLYRFYDPSLQRWPNRDPLGEPNGVSANNRQ